MNIDFDIKLDGFKKFSSMLNQLPRNVENKVLQKAINAAIKEGYQEIKDAAPRSEEAERSKASKKYGHLKTNIRIKIVKRPHPFQRGVRVDDNDGFWGRFYEIGTRHQPARPFFGQAFERAVNKMLAVLGDKLGPLIEKEAEKLK